MKVPVGAQIYEIQLVHGLVDDGSEEGCYGYCDNLNQVIYISDLPQPSEMAVTLGHELLHAWRYHIPCNPNSEEDLAEMVGMGFAQFFMAALSQFEQMREAFSEASQLPRPAPDSAGRSAKCVNSNIDMRQAEQGICWNVRILDSAEQIA